MSAGGRPPPGPPPPRAALGPVLGAGLHRGLGLGVVGEPPAGGPVPSVPVGGAPAVVAPVPGRAARPPAAGRGRGASRRCPSGTPGTSRRRRSGCRCRPLAGGAPTRSSSRRRTSCRTRRARARRRRWRGRTGAWRGETWPRSQPHEPKRWASEGEEVRKCESGRLFVFPHAALKAAHGDATDAERRMPRTSALVAADPVQRRAWRRRRRRRRRGDDRRRTGDVVHDDASGPSRSPRASCSRRCRAAATSRPPTRWT